MNDSPEDQAILEEEFDKNIKPDKAERTRIVERVALGEKEVQVYHARTVTNCPRRAHANAAAQIWFQNRRQSSRRKSRPLLPHEIETRLRPGHSSQSPTSFPSSDNISEDTAISRSLTRSSPDIEAMMKDEPMSDLVLVQPATRNDSIRSAVKTEDTTEPRSGGEDIIVCDGTAAEQEQGRAVMEAPPKVVPATPAQSFPPFADSSSAVQAFTSSSIARPMLSSEFTIPSSAPRRARDEDSPPPTKSLKRTRSGVRLGMTSDGAAKILSPDESSPSPPRLIATASFTGSSGMKDSFCSSQGSSEGFSLRRIPSGRSRDSRAWEFWCDSESRNGLVKQAQQAQKGSAADAIGMLRSNSRGPLTPTSSKPNIRSDRRDSYKRQKVGYTPRTKSGLQRATSAVGRLENQVVKEKSAFKSKPSKMSASFTALPPSSDSDKENDDPVPSAPIASRRRISPSKAPRRRPILGESYTAPTVGAQNDASPAKQKDQKAKKIPADEKDFVIATDDDEVREFMRGSGRKEAAEEDDLDCIQGLLSLSQGNWR